jgi:outer membrane immunogenic protein
LGRLSAAIGGLLLERQNFSDLSSIELHPKEKGDCGMRSKIVGLLAAAVSLGALQVASAADLPTKAPMVAAPMAAPFSWTGFYIGINGGWGWNDTSGNTFCTTPGGIVQGIGCPIFPNGNLRPEGGFGGGQIGYNFQSGPVVWGIEADIQVADISDSISIGTAGIPLVGGGVLGVGTFSQSQKLDWFGPFGAA